jgi:uncharacterized OB-fold protein
VSNREQLLPSPDRDSTPWWQALAEHRFTAQRCEQCGRLRWPARAICGDCASFEWTWAELSGRGVVVSWIVTHHRFASHHESGMVTLFVSPVEQDDLIMPGLWKGTGTPSIGMPVTLVYEDVEGSTGATATLLAWRAS